MVPTDLDNEMVTELGTLDLKDVRVSSWEIFVANITGHLFKTAFI